MTGSRSLGHVPDRATGSGVVTGPATGSPRTPRIVSARRSSGSSERTRRSAMAGSPATTASRGIISSGGEGGNRSIPRRRTTSCPPCTVPRVAVDRPDLPRARRAGGRLGTPGSASLGGAAERHAPRAAPPRRGHPMAVRSYSDSSAPTSRRCLISAWVAPDAQRAIGSFEHGTSLVARLPHVNLFSRVVEAMRLRHGRAETPLQGRRRAECPMRSRAAGDRMGPTAGASPIPAISRRRSVGISRGRRSGERRLSAPRRRDATTLRAEAT